MQGPGTEMNEGQTTFPCRVCNLSTKTYLDPNNYEGAPWYDRSPFKVFGDLGERAGHCGEGGGTDWSVKFAKVISCELSLGGRR